MKTINSSTGALRATSALALAIALGYGAVPGTVAPAEGVIAAGDATQTVVGSVPVTDPAEIVGGQLSSFWKKTICLGFLIVAPLNPPIGVPMAVGVCLLTYLYL